MSNRRFKWRNWSDQKLLELPIRELGVTVEGTMVETCVNLLYKEMETRGLRLRPHVWLSDDWFSPDGIPGFAVPFYLTHSRLMKLERSQMLEVEGEKLLDCMKILRHEAGHTIQQAYWLHRRRKWQGLFGKSSKKYPEYYRPNPISKRFVHNLRWWYGQSHPDEDFAETFAVWLRPRYDWRKRYSYWPALRKLEYCEELMEEIKDTPPLVNSRAKIDPLSRIKKTLGEHYRERRARYEVEGPHIWDRDLRRLFTGDSGNRNLAPASTFLRRNRSEIRKMVSKWTGEYQYTLDTILEDMIARCREMKLRAAGFSDQIRMDFAVMLTVRTMHYLYNQSHREWIPL